MRNSDLFVRFFGCVGLEESKDDIYKEENLNTPISDLERSGHIFKAHEESRGHC